MPQFNPLPSFERLHELFKLVDISEEEYGTQSGLIRKINVRGRNGKAGSIAGCRRIGGAYKNRTDWIVSVDHKLYLVARVIYFMVNKVDPGQLSIDHIDQNPDNNNINNLRLATSSQQKQNMPMLRNNTSGARGVSQIKGKQKWEANIEVNYRKINLGYHLCKIEAAKAYNKACVQYFREQAHTKVNNLRLLKCDCSGCQNRPA